MRIFRVNKEVYINLENMTEIQISTRNVTFIHNGGHVKSSVTSEDFTPLVKAWLIENAIDVVAGTGPSFAEQPVQQQAPASRQAPVAADTGVDFDLGEDMPGPDEPRERQKSAGSGTQRPFLNPIADDGPIPLG